MSISASDPAFQAALAAIIARDEALAVARHAVGGLATVRASLGRDEGLDERLQKPGFEQALADRVASGEYGPKVRSGIDTKLQAAIDARDGKFGPSHVSQLATSQPISTETRQPIAKAIPPHIAAVRESGVKLAINRDVTAGKFREMSESAYVALLMECTDNPTYRAELTRCGYLS